MPLAVVCGRHRVLVPVGERCAVCVAERPSRRARGDMHQAVIDSTKWRRARAKARRRDGGCVDRGEGLCHGRLEGHHIVRVRDGGAPYDLENVLTLCRRHHEMRERR